MYLPMCSVLPGLRCNIWQAIVYGVAWQKLVLWCIEAETYSVDGFQVHLRIGLEILPQLGDEYIHAPAEEVVVLAPHVEQHLFPFQDTVGMFAEKFQEIGFFLGEVEHFLADGELQVSIREIQLPDGK